MRRVVVTGGRDYDDFAMVSDALDFLAPTEVYVGDCPTGADACARDWCKATKTPCKVFEANWNLHGKSAGPKRNGEMVRAAGEDSIVVAFPGGRGTADCTRQARALNRIIFEVKP